MQQIKQSKWNDATKHAKEKKTSTIYGFLDLEPKLGGSAQLTPNPVANPFSSQVEGGSVGGPHCFHKDPIKEPQHRLSHLTLNLLP